MEDPISLQNRKMQNVVRSRRAFTLVEILVVITLVTIMASVGVVNVLGLTRNTRFKESCTLLENKIQNARKLTTLTQGGVTLYLEKKEGYMASTIYGEAIPTDRLRQLFKVEDKLPGIAEIEVCTQTGSRPYPLSLTFYSDGACCFSASADIVDEIKITSGSGNQLSHTIPLNIPYQNDTTQSKDLYPKDVDDKKTASTDPPDPQVPPDG